jgi:hypothetical protein
VRKSDPPGRKIDRRLDLRKGAYTAVHLSGYEVTVVKDATAAYSEEMMHTAFDINMPNYANAIVSTDEFLQSVAAKQDEAQAAD